MSARVWEVWRVGMGRLPLGFGGCVFASVRRVVNSVILFGKGGGKDKTHNPGKINLNPSAAHFACKIIWK